MFLASLFSGKAQPAFTWMTSETEKALLMLARLAARPSSTHLSHLYTSSCVYSPERTVVCCLPTAKRPQRWFFLGWGDVVYSCCTL